MAVLVMVMALMGTSAFQVMASGFNMKSIGAVSTDGKQVSQWWYTASQPTIRGEASPGTDVTVTIDDKPMVVSADSAGEWVFTPTEGLSSGDHSVGLTNGGSQIDFTLTIGSENVDWDAVESGTGEAMPAAGVAWPTFLMIGIGGMMLMTARKLLWTN